MKLLVPFKRVLAPDSRIRVLPDGSGIDTESLSWVVNPFDEIALEEALRLRDEHDVEEIVVVSVGPAEWAEQVRRGLAMGADRGVLVEHDAAVDSLVVARILQAVVLREKPDLVLMGKQAIDDDSSQVGPMLSALLGWPQATFISRLELVGTVATCTRETDSGLQRVEVDLPAVLTTDLRLNEPRYVALPGILRARKKPLGVLSIEDLSVDASPRTRVLGYTPPPARPAGVMVASVEELVRRLRDEARVI